MKFWSWLFDGPNRVSRRSERQIKGRSNATGRTLSIGRTLALEALEDRALLSVSAGLTRLLGSSQPAAVSSATAGSNTTAAVATNYSLQMPQNTRSGMPVPVSLVALDAQNHVDTTYTGPVQITSSDTAATLPTSVSFHNGRAEFQVTFKTSGNQTLTAKDTNNATITATATTNVAAAAVVTHLGVNLPSSTRSGMPLLVQLSALDAQNHPVSTYAGTVNLTSSDTAATLPTSVTFHGGIAVAQVTFKTAGNQTLTATDSSNATLTATGTTNVAAAAVATHFGMDLSSNVVNGSPTRVRLSALDANNRPVSNYTGTVTLTSSDTAATLPTSVTFRGGVAEFLVTFATSGSQTLTATDTPNSLTTTATTTVAPVATTTHLGLNLPSNVRNGSPVVVRLAALDANNHVMTSYAGTVTLASSDTAAVLPTNITFHNGVAEFQVTFKTNGNQTLTATDSANSLTATGTTNVAAAAVATHFSLDLPSNVRNSTPVNVRLMALDASNLPVSNYTGTVTLSSSDTAAVLPTTVTFHGGVAMFPVTFKTAGSQTLTATDSANSLTGTATTNVAAASVATHFALLLQPNVQTGKPAQVRLVALDAQNYVVNTYTGTINLTSSDTAIVLPTGVTFRNGVAEFQVTFNTTGSQTLTATDAGNSALTATVTTSVNTTLGRRP